MSISCSFRPDITFITGINGAGKTTALRLILAMLKASLKDLDAIPHAYATLNFEHDDGRVLSITTSSGPEGTRISLAHIGEALTYTNLDPRSYRLRARPEERLEEHYSILEERFSNHPVMQFLRSDVRTPIFLGLDRKGTQQFTPDQSSYNRDPARMRAGSDRFSSDHSASAGLADVQSMLLNEVRRVRERTDKSAEKLRADILLSAFEYDAIDEIWDFHTSRQKDRLIRDLLQKRGRIEHGLSSLGIEKEKYSPLLNRYFGKFEELARPIERNGSADQVKSAEINQLMRLMASRPMVDRMIKLVDLLDKHSSHVSSLWRHVNRFTELVNRFFRDTGKELLVDSVGRLQVRIENGDKRSVSILSSGERQIVVMLGHLTIAARTLHKGIFLVDEPELSLHLRWQEKFVETMQEASPNAQIIMATHSPAIVMDMDGNCVDIRGDRD